MFFLLALFRCSKPRLFLAEGQGRGYDGGMSSKVTEEQLDMVRVWASAGIDLNGIQKKLVTECGVHLTYMDVRFLLLDHGIEIATAPAPVKAPEKAAAPAPEEASSAPAEAAAPGAPKVTLDELQLPGALISGKVEFPSGTRGAWMIDQMGRFAWNDLAGTPTQEELQAFQFELTQLLSRGR